MLSGASGDGGRRHRPGRPEHPHHARFPIQHVIFLVKENRTFDNYFGRFPGANGATTGTTSDGRTVPLGPLPTALHRTSVTRGTVR
jgi:phospholipase C